MKTYDPTRVSIIIGALIISNWESVTVALEEDEMLFTVGADGEVSRTKNANKLGTITLTLKQTSTSNAQLTALAVTDAIFPTSIVDKSGVSLHVMPMSCIAKRPDASYEKEATDREWVIKGKLTVHLAGGN